MATLTNGGLPIPPQLVQSWPSSNAITLKSNGDGQSSSVTNKYLAADIGSTNPVVQTGTSGTEAPSAIVYTAAQLAAGVAPSAFAAAEAVQLATQPTPAITSSSSVASVGSTVSASTGGQMQTQAAPATSSPLPPPQAPVDLAYGTVVASPSATATAGAQGPNVQPANVVLFSPPLVVPPVDG